MKPTFDKEVRKTSLVDYFSDDEEIEEGTILVALSNKDVPDAKFIISPGKNDERVASVPMDDYGSVRLPVGTDIEIMSGDQVVQRWKVTPKSRQILISKQSVGL